MQDELKKVKIKNKQTNETFKTQHPLHSVRDSNDAQGSPLRLQGSAALQWHSLEQRRKRIRLEQQRCFSVSWGERDTQRPQVVGDVNDLAADAAYCNQALRTSFLLYNIYVCFYESQAVALLQAGDIYIYMCVLCKIVHEQKRCSFVRYHLVYWIIDLRRSDDSPCQQFVYRPSPSICHNRLLEAILSHDHFRSAYAFFG